MSVARNMSIASLFSAHWWTGDAPCCFVFALCLASRATSPNCCGYRASAERLWRSASSIRVCLCNVWCSTISAAKRAKTKHVATSNGIRCITINLGMELSWGRPRCCLESCAVKKWISCRAIIVECVISTRNLLGSFVRTPTSVRDCSCTAVTSRYFASLLRSGTDTQSSATLSVSRRDSRDNTRHTRIKEVFGTKDHRQTPAPKPQRDGTRSKEQQPQILNLSRWAQWTCERALAARMPVEAPTRGNPFPKSGEDPKLREYLLRRVTRHACELFFQGKTLEPTKT